MDIGTPIMFDNIKIEADSDCAFFGLSAAANDDSSGATSSSHLGGFSSSSDTKLSALLSSVSPFTIASGSPSNSGRQPGASNSSLVTEDSMGETLFTSDIVEQLELDLPEFTCDFDLLEDNGFMDTTSAFLREDSDSKDSGTSSTPDAYLGSPSIMDSPPLTPPSPVVKVETETKPMITHGSVSPGILPMLKTLPPGTNLTKILPALKTSRGRSASHDSPDVQALKRHIRMIRNRESASLSRKKKKEYVTSLEERLRELETENSQLKQENQLLKTKLLLHQQSTTSGQSLATKSSCNSTSNNGERGNPQANRTKLIAKVALLGVCCFMMLGAHAPNSRNHFMKTEAISNVSTESKVLQGYGTNPDLPLHLAEFPTNHLRLSRSLAWHDDFKETQHKDLDFEESRKLIKENKTTVEVEPFDAINKTKATTGTGAYLSPRYNIQSRRRSIKLSYQNATLPLSVTDDIADIPIKSNCRASFNKTESLRVQNDLKGLFSRGKPKKKTQQHQPKPFLYSLMDINSVDNNKGLTVYDQRMQRYSNFLEKIQLREDTFYVVSLAMEDQLLLSAKSSNASSRPKMSFLMPWKNDSLGGKEEVMQIDCEVTKVLNLKNVRKTTKA